MSPDPSISQDWLRPPFARLTGHETFAFRFAWLKKGIDQIQNDPGVFHSEDAVVRLGVGKNMVRSIRHWCLATRVAEEVEGSRGLSLQVSEFGRKLLPENEWDPYLEDDATLWLLHWNLASAGTRATTSYWAFNRFREYTFDRDGMLKGLRRWLDVLGWENFKDSTLSSDLDCFIHTYLAKGNGASNGDDSIECPLTTLGLLVEEPYVERGYRFCVGPKPTLPPEIFAYALAEFWNSRGAERRVLEFSEIMSGEGSPSLVFLLDWDSTVRYLDSLEQATNGALRFEEDYEVRRVVKEDEADINALAFLEAYYAAR